MKWSLTFAVLNLVTLFALLPMRWLADRAVTARMATNGIRSMEQTHLLRTDEPEEFNRLFPNVNVNDRTDLVNFLSDHKDTYETLIVDPVSILLLLNTIAFFILGIRNEKQKIANTSLNPISGSSIKLPEKD